MPMVVRDSLGVIQYCSNSNCPNSKIVNPRKCDGCQKDFEPWDVHALEWAGLDIKTRDKSQSLWLLHPKKLGTYCAECSEKIEAFISALNKSNPIRGKE